MNLTKSSEPVQIQFHDDSVKVKSIHVGDSHNLMLTETGELYGNGDNSVGQITSSTDDFLYYYCTPLKINIPGLDHEEPNKKARIDKVVTSAVRSAVMLDNGKVYYWGGYSYDPRYGLKNLPQYDGNYVELSQDLMYSMKRQEFQKTAR